MTALEDRTGTVSGTVLARNNVGSVWLWNIFVLEPEHGKAFSLLLVRRSRWPHLVHPYWAYHRAHTMLSRHQSHHITDDAWYTRLLMLAISDWLRV